MNANDNSARTLYHWTDSELEDWYNIGFCDEDSDPALVADLERRAMAELALRRAEEEQLD